MKNATDMQRIQQEDQQQREEKELEVLREEYERGQIEDAACFENELLAGITR